MAPFLNALLPSGKLMMKHTPLSVLGFALITAGCGGGSASSETSTSAAVLRDVPELRAASGGSGDSGGSSDGGGGGGGSTPAGRHAGTRVQAGFDGSERYTGRFGGPEPAQSLSPECPGWVSAQPNHVIQVPALPFAQLVVTVDGYDTTLAVQLPDGSFRCNDDTNGLNPAVQLEPVPAGQLRVWVGSYSQGNEGEYQMIFTTDRSAGAPTEEDASDY